MRKIFFLILILSLITQNVFGATYTILNATTIFDGDTDCAGACTSADVIEIEGGARKDLLLKDLDGNGSYITVRNDNATRVVMTQDDAAWPHNGVIELKDCSYVDLRGDNLGGETYGIKLIGTYRHGVRVRQSGDHIKISYIEIENSDPSNNTTTNGIAVFDNTMAATDVYDTIEIHHNYIHDTGYAGIYTGVNSPDSDDNPYVSNVSIHNNTLEDLGSYGITLKGVHTDSGVCSVYDNTIDNTGLYFTSEDNSAHQGIGVQYFYGSTYANVYGNTVTNTKGPGYKIGDDNHNVYNNIAAGCGTGDNEKYGHGITIDRLTTGIEIYDNIIIEPTRYGIYSTWTVLTSGVVLSRNLIGEAVLGGWLADDEGDMTESSGADANVVKADVDEFRFNTWSDDSDYSNDNFAFTIYGETPSGSQNCDEDPKDQAMTWQTVGRKHNCRIDIADATDYDLATADSVGSTDATTHSDTESLACDGATINRYVYCEDDFGAEIGLTTITFSIEGDAPPPGSSIDADIVIGGTKNMDLGTTKNMDMD